MLFASEGWMKEMGSYSPCRWRGCRQCQQQNNNLIVKIVCEKTLGMGGKEKENIT
jgi:hypothetical protein